MHIISKDFLSFYNTYSNYQDSFSPPKKFFLKHQTGGVFLLFFFLCRFSLTVFLLKKFVRKCRVIREAMRSSSNAKQLLGGLANLFFFRKYDQRLSLTTTTRTNVQHGEEKGHPLPI
jgi:hypothetical protein